MGVIRQGILGGLSGKVGNVVGASWKGIDYLRALPSQVANPKTIGQQTSRSKMSIVVKLLRSFTALLRIGFGGFAMKMSAFNAATACNLQEAVSGNYPEVEVLYPQLVFSKGNLPGAKNPGISSGAPATVEFAWENNAGTGTAKGGDIALLLICNPAKNDTVYQASGGSRLDQSATIDLPADWSGDTVHGYIAFNDASRTAGSMAKDLVSNSTYAGSVVVA